MWDAPSPSSQPRRASSQVLRTPHWHSCEFRPRPTARGHSRPPSWQSRRESAGHGRPSQLRLPLAQLQPPPLRCMALPSAHTGETILHWLHSCTKALFGSRSRLSIARLTLASRRPQTRQVKSFFGLPVGRKINASADDFHERLHSGLRPPSRTPQLHQAPKNARGMTPLALSASAPTSARKTLIIRAIHAPISPHPYMY